MPSTGLYLKNLMETYYIWVKKKQFNELCDDPLCSSTILIIPLQTSLRTPSEDINDNLTFNSHSFNTYTFKYPFEVVVAALPRFTTTIGNIVVNEEITTEDKTRSLTIGTIFMKFQTEPIIKWVFSAYYYKFKKSLDRKRRILEVEVKSYSFCFIYLHCTHLYYVSILNRILYIVLSQGHIYFLNLGSSRK